MMSLTCEILKRDTNRLTYKTETDSQTQKTNLWLPKGKVGRGINLGLTAKQYYIYGELYSQYFVITYNVKESESLCYIPETL